MIKRLIASLGLIFCLCFSAMANKELSIKLDNKDRVYSERLGFAYLTFEYLYPNGNNAKVRVTVENITSNPPHAVLIFRNDIAEQALKKGKPKIEFEKTFPGKKGTRIVKGCRECDMYINIIPAAVTDTIFTIDVPFSSSKNFALPLYEAKYKAKELFKKGPSNTKYKIMEEHLYDVHIEVVGWSEDDPIYVETKKAVDSFISSLNGVKFCSNKMHSPSLKEQEQPYIEKKDSLIQNINNILVTNSDWMSTDDPHIAYTQLLSELNKVNINNRTYDCGEHNPKPKSKPTTPPRSKVHSCSYCSLSAQGIYQRLDDLYQQLYAGKITKAQALKTAKALYNCYKENNRNSSYGTKILKFYNRIANY